MTNYKPGDKVICLKSDVPYRDDLKTEIGAIGTIIEVRPLGALIKYPQYDRNYSFRADSFKPYAEQPTPEFKVGDWTINPSGLCLNERPGEYIKPGAIGRIVEKERNYRVLYAADQTNRDFDFDLWVNEKNLQPYNNKEEVKVQERFQIGQFVEVIDNDSDYFGRKGKISRDDRDFNPFRVEFPEISDYAYFRQYQLKLVEERAAVRLTVGDIVEIIRDDDDNKGRIAKIFRDDKDSNPYSVLFEDNSIYQYYDEVAVRKTDKPFNPVPRWEIGKTFKTNDGRIGVLAEDDNSSLPYKIDFKDSAFSWFQHADLTPVYENSLVLDGKAVELTEEQLNAIRELLTYKPKLKVGQRVNIPFEVTSADSQGIQLKPLVDGLVLGDYAEIVALPKEFETSCPNLPTLPAPFDRLNLNEVKTAYREGLGKINAIKYVRETLGSSCGLKEAKDFVEDLFERNRYGQI